MPESSLAYFMQLDEPALRAVATLTGGEYFQAALGQTFPVSFQRLR